MKRTACLLVALLICFGCDVFDDDDDPVVFRTVEEATNLRVTQPGTRIFRDSADWSQFWDSHFGPVPADPAPAIDFDANVLAAVFWGERTGCSNAANGVWKVTRKSTLVLVEIGRLAPQDCQAQVHPIQVIELPRMGRPVVFGGFVPG